MKEIYLDNAAATPIDGRVQRAMTQGMNAMGNPSAFNDAGRHAGKILDTARTDVARFLNAHTDEIIFTSSASESNTLAIVGGAFANRDKKHTDIITSPIEHASVLEPLQWLATQGFTIRSVRVDNEGRISIDDIEKKLMPQTLFISLIYASNEVGTIQPIARIGKLVREFRAKHKSPFPLFHVDACQGTGHLPMNVQSLGVDLLTFNGSKIYGPRGVGVLYIRRGTQVMPIIRGGLHERGMRAGTPNVPAAVGLARALELLEQKHEQRLRKLSDHFFSKLAIVLPDARVNGPIGRDRLPNILNISIPDLESQKLLIELDKWGIRAGSGSACTAHSVQSSHVIKALRVPRKYQTGTLRFSLGRQNTKRDMDYLLRVLPKIVKDLKKRYHS